MLGFLGEYEIAIDPKGRLLLPAGFRKQLEHAEAERFVINRGFENCLTLYTVKGWEALTEKINKLNDFNPKVREFKRLFLNGATLVDTDSAARILIGKSLLAYAGIEKDVVFSAQGNKVEIWDKNRYHNYIQTQAENFSDLAAEVAGGDFLNPFDQL